jgi:hypothetical protein
VIYIFATPETEKYTRYIYCYARNGNLYMLYLLRLKQKSICVISIVVPVTENYTQYIFLLHP